MNYSTSFIGTLANGYIKSVPLPCVTARVAHVTAVTARLCDLVAMKNEICLLMHRKQEVDRNLRMSQFREYEAMVFSSQFRHFDEAFEE